MHQGVIEHACNLFVSRYGFCDVLIPRLGASLVILSHYMDTPKLSAEPLGIRYATDFSAQVYPLDTGASVDPRLLDVRDIILGKYSSILDLRAAVDSLLEVRLPDSEFNPLTVLPIGVFVGEPKDICTLLFDQNQESFSPRFNVDGFGERIAQLELTGR